MLTRFSLWNTICRARGLPMPAERTTPPGRFVLLFDGLCKFCQAQVKNLLWLARPGTLHPVDFQSPGALDPFPGVTLEACLREMQLIAPDGMVFHGAEAVFRALGTRRVFAWAAWVYYVPGFRLSADLGYALVAAYRYHLLGKAIAANECEGGTCALHLRPLPPSKTSHTKTST